MRKMRDASASSYLKDPRLAACAVSQEPAWLWSTDGLQVLWANAAGAALFGVSTIDALTARRFEQTERTTQQIVRLATSLTPDSAPRLERLSGFGVGLLQPLTCACSRLAWEDKTSALLICAVEIVRPMLTLAERVRRLFGDSNEALAAFTPAGDLVYATPVAQQRLQQANTLVAIEAGALALDAMKHGESAGLTAAGSAISTWRVGRDANMLGDGAVLTLHHNPRRLPCKPTTLRLFRRLDSAGPSARASISSKTMPLRAAAALAILQTTFPRRSRGRKAPPQDPSSAPPIAFRLGNGRRLALQADLR